MEKETETVENFEQSGFLSGLTFRQAAEVISRATGNFVVVNPFDTRSIERAALDFRDNNSGSYPHITPLGVGGFCYTTISDRSLYVHSEYPEYPDTESWILDCSSWWKDSENFRGTVVECLKEVLVDESLRDVSLPEPEPEHIHGGGYELIGETFYLHYTPVNNHGCSGFRVAVEATSLTEGKIIAGSSCSSCYQVGHDYSDSPVPIGSIVRLPDDYCWLCASEEDPNFMSSHDVSRNGMTMIRPSDLIVLEI